MWQVTASIPTATRPAENIVAQPITGCQQSAKLHHAAVKQTDKLRAIREPQLQINAAVVDVPFYQ